MVINKNGNIVANTSKIQKEFETEEEYNTWLENLEDPDSLQCYEIKKKYLPNDVPKVIMLDKKASDFPAYSTLSDSEKNSLFISKKTNCFFKPALLSSGEYGYKKISNSRDIIIKVRGSVNNSGTVGPTSSFPPRYSTIEIFVCLPDAKKIVDTSNFLAAPSPASFVALLANYFNSRTAIRSADSVSIGLPGYLIIYDTNTYLFSQDIRTDGTNFIYSVQHFNTNSINYFYRTASTKSISSSAFNSAITGFEIIAYSERWH